MLTYHVILPIATAIAVMIREMVQVMAEVLVGAAAVVVAEPAAEKQQEPCLCRHQNFLAEELEKEPVVPVLVAVVLQETPMTANNVAKKKSAAIMANQATAVYQYQLRSAGLQTNVWI